MTHFNTYLLLFFLSSFSLLISCDDDGSGNGSGVPPVDYTAALKDAAPYYFGAALDVSELRNSEIYTQTVKKEFSSITAENAMKMNVLAPSRNNYSWTDADYLVDFAEANNMRVHGHCLIWYKSLPTWIYTYNGTAEDWKTLLKNYITTVVTRYKGRIASWDVVNEALTDDGKPRDCIWLQKLGWEYVELAFRYAHEADPGAKLFYNDYGQEYSNVKLAAINDTILNMISRGVPVHGIGLQIHSNIGHPTDRLINAINKTAQTGLIVHVSELDIALNVNTNGEYIVSDADLAAQKLRYRLIASTMRVIPKEQNWGITTWGVGDKDSWMYPNPDYPLLFDEDYKPKPCHRGVLEAFAIK